MQKMAEEVSMGIRWAYKFGNWMPTREQWIRAVRCVQSEEKERLGQFMFQKDAKSSMAGRLMLRKSICQQLKIPWQELKLGRTARGKPYLLNEVTGSNSFFFNVSHHGDYSVLAAQTGFQVGVDVMKVEYPGGKTVEEYFKLMARQFTDQEWRVIKQPQSDWDRMTRFFRFWTIQALAVFQCLKESYVKALGVGITINLQTIDFHTHSSPKHGKYISDTQVYLDGTLQEDWRFEETMLDSSHCVAIALNKKSQCEFVSEISRFEFLTFEDLIAESETLTEPDEPYWMNFAQKKDRPGVLKPT